jgi:RNase adapter protein RapZ
VDLTVITGMSGAGKSQALVAFEDAGWFCVDNLPPRLLPALADLFGLEGSSVERAAVVCDVRGGIWFRDLDAVLESVAAKGARPRVFFLEASDDALLNRFRETRRPHPLADGGELLEAIERERASLAEVRARADVVIDTSELTIWDLRRAVSESLISPEDRPRMQVVFVSFGYKHGVPRDADLLFDVRFLRNPHYVPALTPFTGLDREVADYVNAAPGMDVFLPRLEALLDFLLPAYAEEGKSNVVVGFGCTGGRHRSVVLAEMMARRYAGAPHLDVSTSHRHIRRGGPTSEPAPRGGPSVSHGAGV